MKTLLITAFFFCTAVLCHAAPPSDQSIMDMMKAVNVEQMVNQMFAQMDTGMKSGMDEALKQAADGKELTPAQRVAADDCFKKLSAAMKDELSFAKTKDIYVRVYRENFTQEEVNSIIAFYSSPAGKAMIQKLPAAMQQAGTLMQAQMGPFMQKMQTMQQDCMKELANAK